MNFPTPYIPINFGNSRARRRLRRQLQREAAAMVLQAEAASSPQAFGHHRSDSLNSNYQLNAFAPSFTPSRQASVEAERRASICSLSSAPEPSWSAAKSSSAKHKRQYSEVDVAGRRQSGPFVPSTGFPNMFSIPSHNPTFLHAENKSRPTWKAPQVPSQRQPFQANMDWIEWLLEDDDTTPSYYTGSFQQISAPYSTPVKQHGQSIDMTHMYPLFQHPSRASSYESSGHSRSTSTSSSWLSDSTTFVSEPSDDLDDGFSISSSSGPSTPPQVPNVASMIYSSNNKPLWPAGGLR